MGVCVDRRLFNNPLEGKYGRASAPLLKHLNRCGACQCSCRVSHAATPLISAAAVSADATRVSASLNGFAR